MKSRQLLLQPCLHRGCALPSSPAKPGTGSVTPDERVRVGSHTHSLAQVNRQFSLSEYIKGFTSPSSAKAARESVLGKEVWVPDEEACYVLGTVSEAQEDGTLLVTTADGRSVSGKHFNACDALVGVALTRAVSNG